MDTTIGAELARLRIQERVKTAEQRRRIRRPKNTRRPLPTSEAC